MKELMMNQLKTKAARGGTARFARHVRQARSGQLAHLTRLARYIVSALGILFFVLGGPAGLSAQTATPAPGAIDSAAKPVLPAGLDAAAVLRKLDANEVSVSSHSVGTITVKDRYGKKVSGFESWADGDSKSLINFTSGEEKGQKILRLKDTIYVAYPEADKAIKIQGSALRDSVAGSDLSYEDMAGERGMASRYEAAIGGTEFLAGEACVILDLKAKKTGLAYPVLKIWVSLASWTGMKVEKYSQNNRLLKTEEVLATKKIDARTLPVKFRMTDHLKGKSRTVFELSVMELDKVLDASLFSLEELGW